MEDQNFNFCQYFCLQILELTPINALVPPKEKPPPPPVDAYLDDDQDLPPQETVSYFYISNLTYMYITYRITLTDR